MNDKCKIVLFLVLLMGLNTLSQAQKPIRVGTTVAGFLEIGYGPAAIAMGDAYVSVVRDISGMYWNPAGLSYMIQNEAMFTYQPWLVEINTFFGATGLVVPQIGTIAFGITGTDYGTMEVTSMELQEGTGENFNASDFAFTFSYARKLANWFGFGASGKFITSNIWHTNANAFAMDLGVIINTPFFSPAGGEQNGMTIGMSLSNYGTRMSYEGLDLMRSVDILPDEAGNYKDVKVMYHTDDWELPLIFRIGVALTPLVSKRQTMTLAVDALHVNNNNESMNVGAEYMLYAPGVGKFFLRSGYRALFLEDSEFGPTFGFGLQRHLLGNTGFQFDYSYRDIGILGSVNSFGVGIRF